MISVNKGNPYVVNQTVGKSYEVNRSTHYDENTRVTENKLQIRENRPNVDQRKVNKNV